MSLASSCPLKVVVQGSIRLKLFSLNDYMGLSQHPSICQAAADAAVCYGMGTCSSASQLLAVKVLTIDNLPLLSCAMPWWAHFTPSAWSIASRPDA